MLPQQTGVDQTARNMAEEAKVRGDELQLQLLNLEQKLERWKEVSANAIGILSQRDVEDDKKREARQRWLDRVIYGLYALMAVIILLMVAQLGYSIGSM